MSNAEVTATSRLTSIMPGFGAADLERAIDFYTGKLGFRVTFRNGAVFAIVERDGMAISLALARPGTLPAKNHAYIKLAGIDALHDEFVARGVAMTHPLRTESYGLREFMITDSEGNTLNFGEPVNITRP